MSDIWSSIEDSAQLTALLDKAVQPGEGPILILKHSTRCAISSMAKRRLESKVDPLISYFIIDLIRYRAISDQLAKQTGVKHESPQAFLYNSGHFLGHWSHMDIRPDAIIAKIT
jgi:bacillithiol system protein YtxJ